MTKTASAPRNQTIVDPDAGQFMQWLMAIGEVEREMIAADPRLRREIGFQVLALILCPISFGYAVFNVAIRLLEHSALHALILASVTAFSLFALDKHYLIQARGDSSESIRKAIYKIRFVSVVIITLSFMLMSTDTFYKDIKRVLGEAKQSRRAGLEQSSQYKLEMDEARHAVVHAGEGLKRADELHAHVAQLQIEQARAWEEKRNQCEGNTTGNEIRKSGCGVKARGFEAAANRLGLEIEAARQELTQLSNVAERLAAAKQQLAAIDTRIDQDAARSVSGSSRKLDALGTMLKGSLSMCLAVAFWFFLGWIPDILMFVAQSRMFNHDLFARMRAVQNDVLQAGIARLRRDLRQQQVDKLAPIEVRLAAVAQPASVGLSDTTAHRRQANYKTEEFKS